LLTQVRVKCETLVRGNNTGLCVFHKYLYFVCHVVGLTAWIVAVQ